MYKTHLIKLGIAANREDDTIKRSAKEYQRNQTKKNFFNHEINDLISWMASFLFCSLDVTHLQLHNCKGEISNIFSAFAHNAINGGHLLVIIVWFPENEFRRFFLATFVLQTQCLCGRVKHFYLVLMGNMNNDS